MDTTAPAGIFPPAPGSTALAGTSAVSEPAVMVPARVVSTRTSPAVMQTVPAGMVLSSPAVSPAVTRTVPPAERASSYCWRYWSTCFIWAASSGERRERMSEVLRVEMPVVPRRALRSR